MSDQQTPMNDVQGPCALCGRTPAAGKGTIWYGDERVDLCHPGLGDSRDATCYMRWTQGERPSPTDFDRIKDLAAKELLHAERLIVEDDPDRYADIAAALRQVASRYEALVEERCQEGFARVDAEMHS